MAMKKQQKSQTKRKLRRNTGQKHTYAREHQLYGYITSIKGKWP